MDAILNDMADRLQAIEETLKVLVAQQTVRDYYDTTQMAALVGKSEFTVREWCRNGRLRAVKRLSGRGAIPAWAIAHTEFLRFQREGLLQPPSHR